MITRAWDVWHKHSVNESGKWVTMERVGASGGKDQEWGILVPGARWGLTGHLKCLLARTLLTCLVHQTSLRAMAVLVL